MPHIYQLFCYIKVSVAGKLQAGCIRYQFGHIQHYKHMFFKQNSMMNQLDIVESLGFGMYLRLNYIFDQIDKLVSKTLIENCKFDLEDIVE